MDELVRRFHTQLSRRDFEAMESTWLELVESGLSVERLLGLAEAAVRPNPTGAGSMLAVLADSLAEQGRPAEQETVLRRQADLEPDNAALARSLAECLRKLNSDVPDLEQLLHKSGLGYGQTLKEALRKLDQYLAFLPGRPVYDAERGPGKVKRLDLLLDRVTVDFDRGAELTWDIGAARRRLQTSPPDGFFSRLARDRVALQEVARERPGEVLSLFLRDVRRPMSVGEMQEGLAAVVPESGWEAFWNRARKEMARNPNVQVRTSPARTFQWADSPTAPLEPAARTGRVLRRKVSAEELRDLGPDRIAAELEKLHTHPERKHFIETLIETRSADCEELLSALFRSGVDARVREMIEQELAKRSPGRWKELLEGALTGYRQNTEAFLWLASREGREQTGPARGLVSRALDLLESDLHREYWTRLRRLLVDGDYRLLRQALQGFDEQEARRLMMRIQRIRMLEGYRADEMVLHVTTAFPALRAVEDDNAVYTTGAGLDKARAELRHMIEVEIPRSADEIARARAHGDLSENYEYKAAKEKQGRLMGRMKALRDEIARARVIGPDDVDTSEVSFGCRVRLTDAAGQDSEYVILGPWEADPDKGVISSLSPFARILLGKKPGERVETGGRAYAIAAVESALAAK